MSHFSARPDAAPLSPSHASQPNAGQPNAGQPNVSAPHADPSPTAAHGETAAGMALMLHLRDGTRARHDAVEAMPYFKAPFEEGFDREAYRALMTVMARAYAAVEAHLEPWRAQGLFGRLTPQDPYAARIHADVELLGGPAAIAPAGRMPAGAPRTPAGALGARYVLDGSMMGGLHLRKALRRQFGEAFVAGLAFHGDLMADTDIKAMRAGLAESLEPFGEEDWPAALDGAHWAFACFEAAHGPAGS